MAKSRKSIRESLRSDVIHSKMSIVESSEGGKKRPGVLCTVEGVLMRYDEVNRNGRLYSKELVEGVLNSPYVKELLLNKTFFGEAQHPGDDRNDVWMEHASHNITKIWLDESQKVLMGRLDVLDTPAGRTVKVFIDYGSILGVSARAEGEVEEGENGVTVVIPESYDFRTFDFVTCPGFGEARVSLTESASGKAFSDKIKTAVESESLTEESGKALKALIEACGSEEVKQFLPRLEERLQKVSTDASTKLTEQIAKTTELQGTVKTLSEELDTAKSEVKRLQESLTATRKEYAKSVRTLESKNSRLQERVNLMVGNIRKYRVATAQTPIIEGVSKPVVLEKPLALTEASTKTAGEIRLGRVLAKVGDK